MFSDEIKYQLDFAKKSKIFYLVGKTNELELKENLGKLKKYLDSTKFKNISLVNYHECFSTIQFINDVTDIVNEHSDKEIYISSSTSTPFEHFYNPLVNIFFWKTAKMREDISITSNGSFLNLFTENFYKGDFKKINKGILSVRRETDLRNYLFSIIDDSKFDGIFRYAKWIDWHEKETSIHFNQVNKFPTFLQLIDEYKKSYVSFVVETEMTDFMNPLTEKTLISFLTKTIPIVLGGKSYVKELKEMGFYVWNDEFGFDGDEYETFSFDKVKSYNKCIETYNQMSINEIQDIYNSNIDKIEHNYKIVSEILFDKQNII